MRLWRSSVSGFTLIELMVTVAVVAVLLTAATPSFLDALEKSRLRAVADQVVDFINSARIKSVKQGRDINVAFDGSTTAWCIGANVAAEPTPGDPITTASACGCNTAPAACVVEGQRSTLDPSSTQGITLSVVPAAITFDNRLGTVSPLGTTVTKLISKRQNYQIQMTVTPLAQVSLCVPSTSRRAIAGIPSC